MARERQLYEDVMDVALRATLKDFGFKRKSHTTYIMDRPERRWIYKLWAEPRFGAGFDENAAVHLPALDPIFEKYLRDVVMQLAGIHPTAIVNTTTPQLMEIAEGHDFYTRLGYRASKKLAKAYKAAQTNPVMKYQRDGWWVLPAHPMIENPRRDGEEFDEDEYYRIIWDHVNELGRFLDEQWRTYVPAWYESCDDPLFIVDWIENRNNRSSRGLDITFAILCHLGGEDERAARYLGRRIDAARRSHDETYSEIHRERRGSWLRGLLETRWSEEQVAEEAANLLDARRGYAEAARRLADGLGIAL